MIWFLRHGEAEQGHPDAARRLTGNGREQATTAGRALVVLGVRLDACLSSPKVRAAETARLACEHLGLEVTLEPALEGGRFDADRISAGLGEVLLVGHEPDLSTAIGGLTGARLDLKKGALAAVEDRELRILLRPPELTAIAGGSD